MKRMLHNHRPLMALAAMLLLLLPVGCDKAKTCRCSVLGTNKVRIIKIEKGACEDLRVFYDHTSVDSLVVDSLLCTGYEFAIDSIFNTDNDEEE